MSTDNEKIIRKLRAIMSSDVKGHSLLMADDEVHTIQTLNTNTLVSTFAYFSGCLVLYFSIAD